TFPGYPPGHRGKVPMASPKNGQEVTGHVAAGAPLTRGQGDGEFSDELRRPATTPGGDRPGQAPLPGAAAPPPSPWRALAFLLVGPLGASAGAALAALLASPDEPASRALPAALLAAPLLWFAGGLLQYRLRAAERNRAEVIVRHAADAILTVNG